MNVGSSGNSLNQEANPTSPTVLPGAICEVFAEEWCLAIAITSPEHNWQRALPATLGVSDCQRRENNRGSVRSNPMAISSKLTSDTLR